MCIQQNLVAAISLSLCAVVASPAQAGSVIYVNAAAAPGGDGTSWKTAFDDLQDGLAAATPGSGDQLWLVAGNYKPTGSGGDRAVSFRLVSGTAIYGGFDGTETRLEERDPARNVTILSGDLNGDDVGDAVDPSHAENSHHVVWCIGSGSGTILDGLTITGGNSVSVNSSGAGMVLSRGSADLINCTISGNAARRAAGLVAGESSLTMTDCHVSSNIANALFAFGPGGVSLLWCTFKLSGCTFKGNLGDEGGAVKVDVCSGTISDCLFTDNIQRVAGALWVIGPLTVSDCQFINNHGLGSV